MVETLQEIMPPENQPYVEKPEATHGWLPYLQEQSVNLAEQVVIRSLDTIPEEIFQFFWHNFGIDLLVNNFNETDIRILEMQIFQSIINHLAYIPLKKLRKPVELIIPMVKEKYEKIQYEDGTEGYVVVGTEKVYKKYVLKNIYWDELIDRVIMRALIMAKRSRQGFTMDKLTSFKTTYGYHEEIRKEPKARWI